MARPGLELRIEGDAELVRRLNDPALIGVPMLKVIQTATREGQEIARSRARSSRIASSILAEAKPLFGRVHSALPQPQANVLEYGRRPGGRMPPPDVVATWAARNGIDPEAAFPIARAIARRGIRGRFFMRAARRHVRNRLPSLLGVAAREIEQRWRRGL